MNDKCCNAIKCISKNECDRYNPIGELNFEEDCRKYNYRNKLISYNDEIYVSDICNLLARC